MHDERSGSGSGSERGIVVGEVEAFDPGPSVAAAVEALSATAAPCALIGGLALDAWGIPRATRDVDLAVPVGKAEPAAERIRRAATEVRPLLIGGVAVREPERNLRIDLIDRRFHFGGLFADAIAEATASRRRARVAGVEVPLVSLEHLLAMKMVSGEPKDESDVRRILQSDRLDYPAARDLVERHLGPATANRLDALARETGRPEVSRRTYENGGTGSGRGDPW
jgi:hypothetical protein